MLKKTKKNKDFIEIYGIHAVKAALLNKKRNHQKLVLSYKNKDKFENFREKIKQIILLPNNEFIKIYGNERNHQGVILYTSSLKQPTIDEIIDKSKVKKIDLIVMLDQVTDPQNIGSIMRSCALFNCHSIIVSKNNSPNITSSIAKAASGGLEEVNYIQVSNLSQTIDKLKKNDYWIVGFDNSKSLEKKNLILPNKCVLFFGSESKGLRNLSIKKCDKIVKIPTKNNNKFEIESLNVANACTIALYEHFKNN